MSDVDDSQPEAPDQVLAAPEEDDDSADITQPSPWMKDLTGLRKWCEDKRTKWPHLLDQLLPGSHLEWIEELSDQLSTSRSRGRVDFTCIPWVLNDIFSFKLNPRRTIAILQYFLGFVAELIMLDTVEDDEVAARIHDLLEASIQPALEGPPDEPSLGLMYSPDANDLEWDILEGIGYAIDRGLHPQE
jgi:hypothetical protein